jgi:hypothetical protein
MVILVIVVVFKLSKKMLNVIVEKGEKIFRAKM